MLQMEELRISQYTAVKHLLSFLDCIFGSGNPGWVLGIQPKWVGPPNLADVLGRTKYPEPSLGSQ
jgi:hypothetical protein